MDGVYLPDHDKFDVGDIFIAGQHQAFFRQIGLDLCTRRAHVRAQAEADINRVAIGDRELFNAANGNRKVIVQSGPGLARVAAKNPIEPDFIRADRVKPGQKPNDRADQNQGKQASSTHAT